MMADDSPSVASVSRNAATGVCALSLATCGVNVDPLATIQSLPAVQVAPKGSSRKMVEAETVAGVGQTATAAPISSVKKYSSCRDRR